MQLIVRSDTSEVAEFCAELLHARLKRGGAAVLATGTTPLPTYRLLAPLLRADGSPELTIFQLDEYVGLADADERHLFRWLDDALLAPAGIGHYRTIRFRSTADDLTAECQRYDAAVESAGGYTLAFLGLGPNGHVGFNEPPSDAAAATRVVELTAASIESNARYWGAAARVPGRAFTAGMEVLLRAQTVVLVATGAHKRDILARALAGPVSPECPASFLRLASELVVVADQAAAGDEFALATSRER